MGARDTKQYLAAGVVNLYMIGYGLFNACVDIEYQTYFDKLLSAENFDWTEYERTSFRELILFFMGPFVGSILFGYIAMKFGRKTALLYMPIPMIMSCLINMCVHEFITFKICIVLGGLFGGGVCVVGPLFLIEIAKDRFRGAILTSLVLAEILGEVLAFSGNLFMKDDILSTWVRILLIATAAAFIYNYFPDTPLSLIKRKKFEEAEDSIRWYKNMRKTDANHAETLKTEFDRIKNAATDGDLEANQMNPLRWADFKTKHARKALAIVMVLGILNVCSSNAKIAVQTALALNPYPMHISFDGGRWIVSTVALLGVYVCIQTIDRIGRKVLITVSAVGTSLALVGNIADMILVRSSNSENVLNLIPAITLLMAIFFGALGIRSLTYTICTEILDEKMKDVGVIFCSAFFWMFSYAFHATFYSAGDAAMVLISAILCLIGAIIVHFILPETKGKSRQEIMKSF